VRLREITALVSPRPPALSRENRVLRSSHDLDDLRRHARRRVPAAVFDYVEGGADEELTLRRNVQAFREWQFAPRCLNDVEAVDTSVSLLGQRLPLPLVLAPTGYSRLMHPDGELAVARAARRAGLPYTLSTVGSTSVDEVAATGHPYLWFQLYVWRDRGLTAELVQRAWNAGYRVLELSIDTHVAGRRSRDVRHGLTIPPRLTLGALAGIAAKPGYWIELVRSPAITFANAPTHLGGGAAATIADVSALFDPTVGWDDLAWMRERWPGALLLKGPVSPEAAQRALDHGADGLHLSNHGGRQLDRLPAPVDTIQAVREAIGDDAAIVLDSGIRHGSDLAVAVALGADAGGIGRAYLYGLMAAGEAGVAHALSLLADQFKRTLQLLGVTSVDELRRHGSTLLLRTPA
jgi:L-lactate dehydrogenase (cytochrome)